MNPTTDETATEAKTKPPEADITPPKPEAPGYGRGGRWGSGQWGSEHNEPTDAA